MNEQVLNRFVRVRLHIQLHIFQVFFIHVEVLQENSILHSTDLSNDKKINRQRRSVLL